MRWLVEAADTKTGQETKLTVEALTEADAERVARYNGLLVSKVSRAGGAPAQVVPYAVTTPTPARLQATAEYPRLVQRARATQAIGIVLTVLGWFAVALGVISFVYLAARGGWGYWRNWRAWLLPNAAQTWGVALGVVAITAGSVLRLLAETVLVFSTVACRGAWSRIDSAEPDVLPDPPARA